MNFLYLDLYFVPWQCQLLLGLLHSQWSLFSASLYERSAYATGVWRVPSVGLHMWAVASFLNALGCRLGWWVVSGSEAVYQILVVIVEGEGAVWGWIKCKMAYWSIIDSCVKSWQYFPTQNVPCHSAQRWLSYDISGGWREIHVQNRNSKRTRRPLR